MSRGRITSRGRAARAGVDWADAVRQYHARVFGIAMRLLRNEHDALDATQEAFFRAMRAADKIDPRRPLFPWLARIVSNICIDWLRRRGVLRFDALDKAAHARSDALRPDQILSLLADVEKLRRCIDRLPDAYRCVVVLKYQAGLSNEDIADMLALSREALRVRLFRAKQMLREMFDPGSES